MAANIVTPDYTTNGRSQIVPIDDGDGDTVLYAIAGAGGGVEGKIYRIKNTGVGEVDMDINTVDFTDTTLWEELPQDYPIVGEYIIRNGFYDYIEIRLFFDVDRTSRFDEPWHRITYNRPDDGLKKDEVFMDYGYGRIDLVYPNIVNSKAVNIPFTSNTIPRLRSVKFLKDANVGSF
jgi:hypothetical protein